MISNYNFMKQMKWGILRYKNTHMQSLHLRFKLPLGSSDGLILASQVRQLLIGISQLLFSLTPGSISLLKEGVYAHVTDQLTVKKVISDDFSASGVCNFYLTARPLYSMSLGMIFPVSLVVYPLFNSSIPDLHTHVSFCRKAVPIPTWSTPSCTGPVRSLRDFLDCRSS